MACVDHEPFVIRLIDQNFRQLFPNPFSAPPDKPLMDSSSFPESGGRSRQGTPVRNTLKTALMNRRLSWAIPPPLPPLSRQMWLQQHPYLLTYVMVVIGGFHFLSCCSKGPLAKGCARRRVSRSTAAKRRLLDRDGWRRRRRWLGDSFTKAARSGGWSPRTGGWTGR